MMRGYTARWRRAGHRYGEWSAIWRTVAALVVMGLAVPPRLGATERQTATTPTAVPDSAAVAAGPALTFARFGYGDQTAETINGSLSYFFPVTPGRQPAAGARLDLELSHSDLLLPERSTVTVTVNDQSVTSRFLTPETRRRSRIEVPLPTAGFNAAGYFVQVRFHLRLTDDPCEETTNPALWATIHKESSLTLPLLAGSGEPGLEDLDSLFAPRSVDPTPVTLVLPAAPGPEELEAAGVVALQLGRWAATAGVDPEIEVVTGAAVPPDRPAVYVAGPEALGDPLGWAGLTHAEDRLALDGTAIPAENGILAIARQPVTGQPRLLVSGGGAAALRLATEALVRPERRALLSGTHALLTGEPVAAPPRASLPWTDGAASFAQLGRERQEVTGPGLHELTFPFERPPGWTLRDGGTLELAVEPTSAIRAETSWVGVAVNDLDLGTQRLIGEDGRAGGRYQFELPADLLSRDLDGRPLRRLDLRVQLFLDVPQDACEPVDADAARATVLPTSAWRLPHDAATGLDLARFPAPLQEPGGETPLLVVVPAAATSVETATGLRLIAAAGRWVAGAAVALPRLLTADLVAVGERDAAHLLLVGGPDRNAISAAAMAAAPELFRPDRVAVAAGVSAAGVGLLHLAPSPWDDGRAVLAVAGDEAALDAAASTLSFGDSLSDLHGRAAAVVPGLPAQPLAGAEDPAPPLRLAPRVAVPAPIVERLAPYQIVGAILLGAFVAFLILILALRYLRRARGGGGA